MNEQAIKDLKWHYNHNLERYYNGCKYMEEHRNEMDKWIPEILTILETIENLLKEITKYEQVKKEEILGGFRI